MTTCFLEAKSPEAAGDSGACPASYFPWAAATKAAEATAIAFYVATLGGLIKAFAAFMGLFSAPILALFLLGVLTRRTRFTDWLIGLAASIPLTLWVQHGLRVHWVWYFPLSFTVTFLTTWLAGYRHKKKPSLEDSLPAT